MMAAKKRRGFKLKSTQPDSVCLSACMYIYIHIFMCVCMYICMYERKRMVEFYFVFRVAAVVSCFIVQLIYNFFVYFCFVLFGFALLLFR